jgi:hypothetical protein
MKRSLPLLFLTLCFSLGAWAPSAWADELKLRDDAPDRHVVVKGDTLWDISAKFLKDPWRWPDIWGMNREQIANPHLIYPGDVIVLDRSGGEPRLVLEKTGAVKLSPQVRAGALAGEAISAIPAGAIEPFLSRPRVVEDHALDDAPIVLGNNDERFIFGAGDRVYATRGSAPQGLWNIVRPGKALTDPDSKASLGYEVEFVGEARTVREGDPQQVDIVRSVLEVNTKDRLVPLEKQDIPFEYLPRAPEKSVNGRIISAYGGVSDTGPYNTVLLNRGGADGLAPGHVLAVYRQGRAVELPEELRGRGERYPTPINCLKPGERAGAQDVKADCMEARIAVPDALPDERSGLVMVYRVFDKVAYALVMQTNGPVFLLDSVRNP